MHFLKKNPGYVFLTLFTFLNKGLLSTIKNLTDAKSQNLN